MQRILINENKNQQNNEINKITWGLVTLNGALSKFVSDTGYQPDITEMTNSDRLKEALNSFFESQFDRQGLVGKLMREKAKPDINQVVSNLTRAVNSFMSSDISGYWHNLVYMNGILILPPEIEEQIRDTFRLYLSSESAVELHDQHHELAEHLTKFVKLLKEKSPNSRIESLPQLISNFFVYDNIEGSITANKLNYDLLVTPKFDFMKYKEN